MTGFPFDLIGFDLDGTLVDSAPDLAAAVNHVLAEDGHPPLTVDAVRTMMGGGARVMLGRALDAAGAAPDRLEPLYPRLIAYYEAHIADRTRPFPGVEAALDDLRVRGVALAVVTNKVEHLAIRLLREIGLLDRFACVIGGDTMGVGKPDPAPIREMIRRCGGTRAAFVGDTVYDVQGAHAAGLPCVLFVPDGNTVPGADARFDHYGDLTAILRLV